MDNWLKSKLSSPVINYFGRKKEQRCFSKSPIFIGGCGRSGTTLLLAILSAHPNLWAVPIETDAFTSWEVKADKIFPKRIDRFYRQLLINRIPKRVTRWCEKRPYNVKYIQEILNYFGTSSKFIHIVRDPRAVCTSYHPSAPDQYWIPIDRYINDVNAGLKFVDHPQVLTIQFEKLLLNTSEVIAEIVAFIEEPLLQEMKLWQRNATIRTHKAWKDGLYTINLKVIDKWKSPEHDKRIEQILGNKSIKELMIQLGYS